MQKILLFLVFFSRIGGVFFHIYVFFRSIFGQFVGFQKVLGLHLLYQIEGFSRFSLFWPKIRTRGASGNGEKRSRGKRLTPHMNHMVFFWNLPNQHVFIGTFVQTDQITLSSLGCFLLLTHSRDVVFHVFSLREKIAFFRSFRQCDGVARCVAEVILAFLNFKFSWGWCVKPLQSTPPNIQFKPFEKTSVWAVRFIPKKNLLGRFWSPLVKNEICELFWGMQKTDWLENPNKKSFLKGLISKLWGDSRWFAFVPPIYTVSKILAAGHRTSHFWKLCGAFVMLRRCDIWYLVSQKPFENREFSRPQKVPTRLLVTQIASFQHPNQKVHRLLLKARQGSMQNHVPKNAKNTKIWLAWNPAKKQSPKFALVYSKNERSPQAKPGNLPLPSAFLDFRLQIPGSWIQQMVADVFVNFFVKQRCSLSHNAFEIVKTLRAKKHGNVMKLKK